jgi:hypothetical protein
LALAARWGLLDLGDDRLELIAGVERLAGASPWSELANREDAILAAACGPLEPARELAEAAPSAPSEAVRLAHGHGATTLLLARARGGEWLDRYAGEWRAVRLEIGGADLLEAGVEEGPAVGRGLEVALAAKLDGRVRTRDDELRIALDAAREGR